MVQNAGKQNDEFKHLISIFIFQIDQHTQMNGVMLHIVGNASLFDDVKKRMISLVEHVALSKDLGYDLLTTNGHDVKKTWKAKNI